MKLWKNNRVDQEYELSTDEIVERFLASKFSDLDQYPWQIERAFTVFVATSEDEGGLSSSWDGQEEFDALLDVVCAARNKKKEAK